MDEQKRSIKPNYSTMNKKNHHAIISNTKNRRKKKQFLELSIRVKWNNTKIFKTIFENQNEVPMIVVSGTLRCDNCSICNRLNGFATNGIDITNA